MAYTTAQNKAIADFRAVTNVDKTMAAKLLKASAWNPTQAVNLYATLSPFRSTAETDSHPDSTTILAVHLRVRLAADWASSSTNTAVDIHAYAHLVETNFLTPLRQPKDLTRHHHNRRHIGILQSNRR